MNLELRWLGRVSFADALALQDEIVTAKRRGAPADHLLLLEHEPVYTIGRTVDHSSLHQTERLPFPLVQTNRGGQATYHGPGQLVGYPILDLRTLGSDLHRYLRAIETILIDLLELYGIPGQRRATLTGVWVETRKIASIGVGVRHWISMHGFALNVCGDLSPFRNITPCGIADVEMTSMEQENGRTIAVHDAAERLSGIFEGRLRQLLGGATSGAAG